MQGLISLVILFLVFVLIVFPIWTIIKILGQRDINRRLEDELLTSKQALEQLRAELRAAQTPGRDVSPTTYVEPEPETRTNVVLPSTISPPPAVVEPLAATPTVSTFDSSVDEPPAVATSPAATFKSPELEATLAESLRASSPPESAATSLPPELPPPPALPAYTPRPSTARPRINWEQFLGAKGFAWAGGVALLLGAVYFVKYSFEHDWIPAEVRVAIGFLFGISLLIGGLKTPRPRYAILAHTLCATGVVCLYAVTFACNAVYHFSFFGPLPTFALMALITATAFMLAIRLEAQVVAVLGILGGFLTPVLLSTGRDNPPGLFGYLALLNIGLIATALHRRWSYLVPLGAAGTVIMQLGWAEKFWAVEKAPVVVIVCLGYCALFLAAYLTARRLQRSARAITWSAVAFPFVAFGFAFFFLAYAGISNRPGLLFSFVLLADLALLALAWFDEELPALHLAAGLTVFTLLATWTGTRLTTEMLPWALAFYLLYAALHTAFPLVLQRRHPEKAPTWWSQLFPPLALLLMMGPLFKLETISLLFWPCVLLVDVLAIGLAMITASLTAVAVVLVMTLFATGLWIFRVPAYFDDTPLLLLVVGGFALIFFVAGIFLARKLGSRLQATDGGAAVTRTFGDARAQLPAFAALLPFLLLIMMTQRLPLADPSPVFGLALLLIVLTLGLALVLTIEWLPACALAGVAGLEYAWYARQSDGNSNPTATAWFVGFWLLFAAYPLLFRRRFSALTGPWAIAALGGVIHFPLVNRAVTAMWPSDVPGLVPLVFAVPPLLTLIAVLRSATTSEKARLNQLAWLGGATLFFITLIFPIQFERQWITISWALEGVALLWLFHRVPHPGLRGTGVMLLVVAFVRLALNPAVFDYHPQSNARILNWYLYSYGLTIAALFIAAHLLAAPRNRVFKVNVPPLLNALGTVLAFLLLNIEIADYFSGPNGGSLTFQFSGNFARDMTYTIAWALFSLGLLLMSIWKNTKIGRYCALALLSVTMLKLFFHDLSELGQLYRVAALMVVAAIAIGASFAYQRFLPHQKRTPDQP